jgi:hypothetical protein
MAESKSAVCIHPTNGLALPGQHVTNARGARRRHPERALWGFLRPIDLTILSAEVSLAAYLLLTRDKISGHQLNLNY